MRASAFVATLISLSLLAAPAAGAQCTLAGVGPGSLRAPLAGRLTSDFGGLDRSRDHTTIGEVQTSRWRPHQGFDLEARPGEPVRAAAAGTVVFAGDRAGTGRVIEIAHGGGVSSLYAGLAKVGVAEGACVEAGQALGEIGCSGPCETARLHFEVRTHGQPTDPAPLMVEPPVRRDPAQSWRGVDRLALFDAVVAATRSKFLDGALIERIGWPARARAARERVAAAATAEATVDIINTLLAELQTSHTSLYTPDDDMYYVLLSLFRGPPDHSGDATLQHAVGAGPAMPAIGAFTRRIGERHFVDGVLPGSPAAVAGLRLGDEMLRVDGAPFSPVAAFRGKVGAKVTLTVRLLPGGETHEVVMPVEAVDASAALTAATRKSGRVIEMGGRRVGYLHVWTFSDATGIHVGLGALKLDTLDHLVIDVRGKVGGYMNVVSELLALLDDPNPDRDRLGDWRTGTAAIWHDANNGAGDTSAASPRSAGEGPRIASFRGRSALLIDERTRSAGEIMAYAFRRGGFGPLVGARTAGAVSSGGTFLMPGGLLLYVAVLGHLFDGRPLERVGVLPDVPVDLPIAFAGGADPVLDTAVRLLVEGAR